MGWAQLHLINVRSCGAVETESKSCLDNSWKPFLGNDTFVSFHTKIKIFDTSHTLNPPPPNYLSRNDVARLTRLLFLPTTIIIGITY